MCKPELLAPAGSPESFHAAIEAGADAIYLGLKSFNARQRAANFTSRTLSYLVPYAHKNKVKIYCALNTLVKQNELRQVVDLLYQLEQIGIDAVILHDWGVAGIVHTHFPKLALHASTQMVIHNSLGVKFCESFGFKRVILSRECTLSEIMAIKKTTDIELELFIHGALCFSISGLCLASSYLGGNSGNRGYCTQVCRRKFISDNKSGFFFSPKDLCAIDLIPDFIQLGIASLKIEGRMKSAEYVYRVVSAYRNAINDPDTIPDAKEKLHSDFGRQKTQAFFSARSGENIIDESSQPGTGIPLGPVTGVHASYIEFKTDEKISAGDKIRLAFKENQEGCYKKVRDIRRHKNRVRVFLENPENVVKGAPGFLLKKDFSKTRKWSKITVDTRPVKFNRELPSNQRIIRQFCKAPPKVKSYKKHSLYLRFDNPEWLFHLASVLCDGIILNCTREILQNSDTCHRILKRWAAKLILALPPFICQTEIPFWRKTIADLHEKGIHSWICSHLSQKYLFSSGDELHADTQIGCLNKATQNSIRLNGFYTFFHSPEDDILNIKATNGSDSCITLFAYVPLFISRMQPSLSSHTFITDKKQCGFFTRIRDDLFYLIGEKPLCLTHRRDKIAETGINAYILDFSFCPVQKKILNTVLSYYHSKKKVPYSTLFNHKAGLK